MYKDDKPTIRKKVNSFETPLGVLVPFVSGLALGFVVFIFLGDGSYRPFQPETGTSQPETEAANTKPVPAIDIDYEFYRLLPNKKVVNLSEYAAEQLPIQGAETADDDQAYILQVGSFKQVGAAEQVKAQLALLGVNAGIQRVVIDGQDIRYRVRAGPYTDQQTLDNERRRLQENNMEFIILTLHHNDLRINESDGLYTGPQG